VRARNGPTRGRWWLLVAALLLCTGCQARLVVELVVDRHGAGELAVALGADAELLAQAAEAGADPLGDLVATGTGLAEDGWEVRDETDAEGARTVRLARAFDSPEELASLADELAGALAAPELVPLENLRVALTDDVIELSGTAGLVPTEEVTSLGVQPDQAVALLADRDAVRYEVRATLPGEVLKTNAEVEGGVLTWRIEPGEQIVLAAQTSRPSGTWWVLAGSGALGGLLALGLLAVVRRSRARSAR
jgi:hypothetical protein